MRHLNTFPWITTMFAVAAGTALADGKQVAITEPAPLTETANVPAGCQRWLALPAEQSETLPWEQRLSFAACRQQFSVSPTSDPAEFNNVIASIDRAMAPSFMMYRDAMERGATPQIQILGAYGLAMANVDTMVRARSAIRVLDGGAGTYGGATYGATLDRYQIMSRALEPQLAKYRDAAVAAFNEVVRLADQYPDWARANRVMTWVVDDARRQLGVLSSDTATGATWH
jgi:hypothetical protein